MLKDVPVKQKMTSSLRWVMLFLTCLLFVINYYAFDIPAALHQQLAGYMGNAGNHFETYFQLLYTLYSVPNVILPFFGGYFVDKWGVRPCFILFMILVVLGESLFTIGIFEHSWTLMFIGRVCFGIGTESLFVAFSIILSQWFKSEELALAFGLNSSIARLGSVANNFGSPRIAAAYGLQAAVSFGLMLSGLGFLLVLGIVLIDSRFEKSMNDEDSKINPLSDSSDTFTDQGPSHTGIHITEKPPAPEMREVLKFRQAYWILIATAIAVTGCVVPFNNISSPLLLERNYFVAPESNCALTNVHACETSTNMPLSTCTNYYVSDTNQPPLPAGNVTTAINCVSFKDANGVYSGCYSDFCERQLRAVTTAGATMSIPYFIYAGLSPFLGAAVDKFGQRAVMIAVSLFILVLVHLVLGLTTVNPIYPLIGQGLAFTAFQSVFLPSIPLMVEKHLLGLAFGAANSILNAAWSAIPLIIAAIYHAADDRFIPNVEMFFVGLNSLGLVFGIYLNYYDHHHNRVLNSPGDLGAKAFVNEIAKKNTITLDAIPDDAVLSRPVAAMNVRPQGDRAEHLAL